MTHNSLKLKATIILSIYRYINSNELRTLRLFTLLFTLLFVLNHKLKKASDKNMYINKGK
uniref:Uncharacterized protein n=1 Tax=Rhizophora mucronata TaxID=61149 RepID=A0A2P2NNB6_RHIMU